MQGKQECRTRVKLVQTDQCNVGLREKSRTIDCLHSEARCLLAPADITDLSLGNIIVQLRVVEEAQLSAFTLRAWSYANLSFALAYEILSPKLSSRTKVKFAPRGRSTHL